MLFETLRKSNASRESSEAALRAIAEPTGIPFRRCAWLGTCATPSQTERP